MRRALFTVALLGLALTAIAQTQIKGITIFTATRFEFTNCEAAGSAVQTVTEGTYLFRVTDEAIFLCYAAQLGDGGTPCGSGGEKFPAGMAMMLSVKSGGQVMSCRSAGAAGDAIFTKATQP